MNVVLLIAVIALAGTESAPQFSTELIFPLHDQHNHAPGIVECPNGDLLVTWYRGAGERSADDVAVYGARRKPSESAWSEPFVMADTLGFPDCNTCMMIDRHGRLRLFWPVILANSWESCLTKCRTEKAEEFCEARQDDALESAQRGFTENHIRWACSDVGQSR